MTQKQLVAYGLITVLLIAVITAIIEPASEDKWYSLAGIGFGVFGVWASILLLKKETQIKKDTNE